MRRLFLVGLGLAGAGMVFAVGAELRTWTSSDGRTLQAKLVSHDSHEVVLELVTGLTAKVPLFSLSAADQAFVKESASSASVPPEKRTWPANVEVDPHATDMKMVTDDAANHRYVYQSQSFQFVSPDKLAMSVMKDVARTFEATRALVQALPWGVDPKPPANLGYFQAKFYIDHKAYVADGAPPNSGGVYFNKDRIFRVPFESLGLEERGKTWFKKTGFKEETLVHEVTHQMMDGFLPFLPLWVIEGTAEYTRSLPYNAGKFRAGAFSEGLKEYIKEHARGAVAGQVARSFGDQMAMKREEWTQLAMVRKSQHSLYFQSYLLVYYFCHLDGDGKGTRFIRYFDEIEKAHKDWQDFMKNPLVKLNSDGGFTYPANLPLPTEERDESFGLKKLDVLLDGRSISQIDRDVKEGYKKIGIKL